MQAPYESKKVVAAQLNAWCQENQYPDWDTYLFHVKSELSRWDDTVESGLKAMMREEEGVITPRLDVPTVTDMLWALSQYGADNVEPSTLPIRMLIGESPLSADFEQVLAARLPHLEIQRLDEPVHEMPWEAPEAVWSAVLDLTRQIDWG